MALHGSMPHAKRCGRKEQRQVRMQLQAGGYQAAQHRTHLYGSSSSCKDGTASMPFVRLM